MVCQSVKLCSIILVLLFSLQCNKYVNSCPETQDVFCVIWIKEPTLNILKPLILVVKEVLMGEVLINVLCYSL